MWLSRSERAGRSVAASAEVRPARGGHHPPSPGGTDRTSDLRPEAQAVVDREFVQPTRRGCAANGSRRSHAPPTSNAFPIRPDHRGRLRHRPVRTALAPLRNYTSALVTPPVAAGRSGALSRRPYATRRAPTGSRVCVGHPARAARSRLKPRPSVSRLLAEIHLVRRRPIEPLVRPMLAAPRRRASRSLPHPLCGPPSA
jgi:hypothetical protein